MSDLELLFLVLAVLYGWECGCWVRRGSVAFRTWLGRRWCLAHTDTLLGNQRGGFIFAPPLPPLGAFVAANQFPLSLSPDGALAYVSTNVNPGWRPPQTGKFFRFDEIRDVAARGRKLLVNGEPFLTASSPTHAAQLAAQLRRLSKLAEAQREPAINEIVRNSLDGAGIERRWLAFQKQAKPVRLLANVLVAYLFLSVPAMIWRLGFLLCWPGLLIGLVALTTATAIFFRRAHKALYPEADDERLTHFIMVLLAPTVAMRAHDVLSRPLLESFHPLAVAKVLCPESEFREFARKVLLDLRHPALPVSPGDDAAPAKVEGAARETLLKAVEDFLKQAGLDPDELCAPPPADESCQSYCPRCGAQFTTISGKCPDCGGLPLTAFPR
jgi:hypothetical protein